MAGHFVRARFFSNKNLFIYFLFFWGPHFFGCQSPSFLPPAHSTAMSKLPEPSGLTSIVYYGQDIRCAPAHHDTECIAGNG